MKQPDDRAVLLLRPLKLIQTEPEVVRVHSDRERVVRGMQGLVRAAPRRRLYGRVISIAMLGSTAVAAGYVAVWAFGTMHPGSQESEHRLAAPIIAAVSGEVQVSNRRGLEHPGLVGTTVEAAESITSGASGAAALVLSNGARVQLSPASQLVVTEVSQQHTLTLKRGTVSLSVPKLGPHQELAVTTASARVVVVGTRFWVSVMPGTNARAERTCVGVQRGTVAIVTSQGRAPLSAGRRWSSDGVECTPAPPLPAAAPEDSTTIPKSNSWHGTPSRAATPTTTEPAKGVSSPRSDASEPNRPEQPLDSSASSERAPEDSALASNAAAEQSSLDAQNRLFAAAIAAQRAGQVRQAAELLEELLTRYPDSPLAEQASQELASARSTLDESANRDRK